MTLHSVTSERLSIRMAHEDDLRADLEDRLSTREKISPDWPPLYWDKDVLRWSLAKIAESPRESLWRPWLICLRGSGILIGTCGFKGPPNDDGLIECGYGVVASHHCRGIATEAVSMLLKWAWVNTAARGCIAHTLPGDPASGGVLQMNGFAFVGSVVEPNEGTVDRWLKHRAPSEARG